MFMLGFKHFIETIAVSTDFFSSCEKKKASQKLCSVVLHSGWRLTGIHDKVSTVTFYLQVSQCTSNAASWDIRFLHLPWSYFFSMFMLHFQTFPHLSWTPFNKISVKDWYKMVSSWSEEWVLWNAFKECVTYFIFIATNPNHQH